MAGDARRALSLELFGTDRFQYMCWSGDGPKPDSRTSWMVFSESPMLRPPSVSSDDVYVVRFFHGLTLSQCHSVFTEQRFSVGLHREGSSKTHPSGI